MMRVRFVGWLMLLGAVCTVAPGFESTASGFGRCRSQPAGCCVQYVYVYCPVYIEKEGGGGEARDALPQIRFILVLDTADKRISEAARESGAKIRQLLEMFPEDFTARVVRTVEGEDLTRDNVLNAVRNTRVNPGDTLVVYCNIHGQEDPAMVGGQVLNMWAGLPDETQRTLRRQDLEQELANKPCRLKVLITDSCFAPVVARVDPYGGSRELQVQPPPRGTVAPPPPPEVALPEVKPNESALRQRLVKNLYLDHEGMLSLNSASDTQYSLTDVFSEAFAELSRGYFRDPQDPKDYRPDPAIMVDWQGFVDRLARRVNERFKAGKSEISKQAQGNDPSQSGPAQDKLKMLESTENNRRKQETQDVQVFQVPGQATQYPAPSPVETFLSRNQGGSSGTNSTAATGTTGAGVPGTPSRRTTPELLTPPAPSGPVSITVHIAPGTSLYLEDTPTKQMGAERYFQTRALAPGEVVTYTFRAESEVDGQKVVETQKAVCRAGRETVVRFEKFQSTGTSVASR